MVYEVVFTRNYKYYVTADDEDEAKKDAEKMFQRDETSTWHDSYTVEECKD